MLNVTTLNDLEAYSQGQVVELPPFAEGMPFVARLRRPSMLAMMKSGKIPNTLLSAANALFAGTTPTTAKNDENAYKEVFDVIEILVESSLLSPTLEDLKLAGVELTDDQLMFIFNYAQRGVKALETFRTK